MVCPLRKGLKVDSWWHVGCRQAVVRPAIGTVLSAVAAAVFAEVSAARVVEAAHAVDRYCCYCCRCYCWRWIQWQVFAAVAVTEYAVPAVATARHSAAGLPAVVDWRWHFAEVQPGWLGSAASAVSAARPAVATAGLAVAVAAVVPAVGCAVAAQLGAASSCLWQLFRSEH